MDITKEDYFNVKYNENRDVLEVHNSKKGNVFKNHKFIISILGISFILVSINLYLIYKFFEVLCTI